MTEEKTFFYQKVRGLDILTKRAILEDAEVIDGFNSIVVFERGGYRCGYVGVDSTIPEFKEIEAFLSEVEAHGVPYCYYNEDFDKAVGAENAQYWVGYDCNHSYDGKDFDTVEKYFGKSIRDAQENINGYFYGYEVGNPVSLESCKALNKTLIGEINNIFTNEFGKNYDEIVSPVNTTKKASAKTADYER